MTSSIASTPFNSAKTAQVNCVVVLISFHRLSIIDVPPSSLWTKVAAVWDLGLASKIWWNFLECSQALHPWCLKKKNAKLDKDHITDSGPKWHKNLTLKSASPTTGAVGRTFVWLLKKLCRCSCWLRVLLVAASGFLMFFGCWIQFVVAKKSVLFVV